MAGTPFFGKNAKKTIFMKAHKTCSLTELKEAIQKTLEADCVSCSERCIGEVQTLLLVLEEYYFRSGGYVSVTVLLTEHGDTQFADIIGSGGGDGIFNLSWGANSNFAKRVEKVLETYGFTGE